MSVELLSRTELRRYFPDSRIVTELLGAAAERVAAADDEVVVEGGVDGMPKSP
jgi:hypothetical protein